MSKDKLKILALITIVMGGALLFIDQYETSANGPTVINNIQKISDSKLLSMAAEMNTPEWNDILLEAAEWTAVAGVTYASYGFLAQWAGTIKILRTTKKVKDISEATHKSYTLLNKVIKPFYKTLARPFNKRAISFVNKTSGVYLFFNKKGKVKYVGKAADLRRRLGQHLIGPTNSGNLLLSKNSKSLSFIAIPIKAIGDNNGAIKCVEAIGINAFNGGDLYNKRIEKIIKNDCRQLIRR